MHPAASVIFFTSLSGLGYGLIVALSLTALLQLDILPPAALAVGLFIGMAIAAFGLSLSLFHLGHPERAWRALSQWRSSWLSREGVLAVMSFAPNLSLVGLLFFGMASLTDSLVKMLLIANIVLSLATVFATAMIYRSLRTIGAWFTNWVPCGYLSLALASGFLLASAYCLTVDGNAGSLPGIAFVCIALSAAIKIGYWRSLRIREPLSNAASAFGLENIRGVKQFVAPHSQENYLLQEMGYRIARKHADKLRLLCIGIGFVVTLLLLIPALAGSGQIALVCVWLGVLAVMFGIILERWLFFAEAKHTVGLYYGR
ncbi:MAG: dimethyl sulfoxide reductase anchor subunit family protein [Gammaproteobacteria bacterium]